jgi:hypothetical protein
MDNNENRWQVDFEILKEKFKHQSETLSQKERELERVKAEIRVLSRENTLLLNEKNKLKFDLLITKERFKVKEAENLKEVKGSSKKKLTKKFLILLTSILFFLSSLLSSYGVNLLTSTPPDSAGNSMVIFAIMIFIVATFISFTTLGETNNA